MNELMQKLTRPLDKSDVELRVGTTTTKGFSLLLYKTARVDVRRLNEVFGIHWSNKYHYDDKGLLCSDISIYDVDSQQWITRSDVGTESREEKEKGSYSDSFKRTGFKWDIGSELYNAPFVWVNWSNMKEKQVGNRKVYTPIGFYPSNLEIVDYEVVDGQYVALTITHDGKSFFRYGEKSKGWPVYDQATPRTQIQALSEFKGVCDGLDVDPIEFLQHQGNETATEKDKYKSVRHWLNGNVDQLREQLLIFRQE